MELELEGSPVSCTTVHPGGVKTNIARNARVDPSVMANLSHPDAAADDFDKLAHTSPESAARQILRGVTRDRRRVLVGADATAIDLTSRLPPPLSHPLIANGPTPPRP